MNCFMDILSPLRPPESLRFVVLFPFGGNQNLSFGGPSADNDKRMNAEEAESAEIISRKLLGAFDLPGSVGNGVAFPPASWP
jgi:hypothetical protein